MRIDRKRVALAYMPCAHIDIIYMQPPHTKRHIDLKRRTHAQAAHAVRSAPGRRRLLLLAGQLVEAGLAGAADLIGCCRSRVREVTRC